MSASRNVLGRTTILLGCAVVALSGCSKDFQDYNPLTYGEWRDMEKRAEAHVEEVSLEHFVAFQPNAIRLGDEERRRLLQFVDESALNTRDDIILQATPGTKGSGDPVAKARVEDLEREFLELGLPVRISRRSAGPVSVEGADQVAVFVRRAVAIPPECRPDPAWTRPDYQMGCYNNAGLAYMVADPRDLAKGRTIGPADGDAASLAVKRYRTEKEGEDEFVAEETTN